MRKLRAADLFCGAGGTSIGAETSGAAKVVFAVNHWKTAVETHSANFPDAKHVNSRIDQVNPSECGKLDILFASPECTHHSRARGGKPTSDQQRAGAWDIMKWIDYHRPSWIVIENVIEWQHWGPVHNGQPMKSRKGAFFDAWLMAAQSGGYRADYRRLNAADFGAGTSRERLFVILRKGNRNPVFPEPAFTQSPGGEFPGMSLPRWRPAYESIDWGIPCPSIWKRSRPLADKTLLRIEAGLRKFCGPFVAQWDQQSSSGGIRSVDDPFSTFVTKANQGLAMPFQVVFRNNSDANSIENPLGVITAGGRHAGVAVPTPFICGCGARDGQSPPKSVSEPLNTVVTKDAKCLVQPFVIGQQSGSVARDVSKPIPAIATSGVIRLAVPFLGSYYGTGGSQSVSDPLDTVTTKDRHSLCIAICRGPQDWPEPTTDAQRKLQATIKELGIADVGFRMLTNPELASAQGFPSEYIFHGTKSDVTRQIGNSVSPPVAEHITRAIAGA